MEKLRKRVSEYDWDEAERLVGGDADEDWQKLKASRDAWEAVKKVQERVGGTIQGAGVTIQGTIQGAGVTIQGAGATIQETVGGKIQDVQQALQGVVTGWVAGSGDTDGAGAGKH